jgi:hypothetical protein
LPNTPSIQLNGSDIRLKAEVPAGAGDKLDFVYAQDNNLWLNYSAVTEEAKEIYLSIVDGVLPSGVALKVDASFTEEGGQGNIGQAQGAVTLSTQNQRIIRGITTYYTGEGLYNGRQLAYSLVATNTYTDIKAVSNKTITVCYTITD